jgi:hypothetical protein
LKVETDAEAEQCALETGKTDEGTSPDSRACPLHMTICNELEIAKEITTLLTKEIAGQLGKSKALGTVIRFYA